MIPPLIATCWISAGNVAPNSADQTSPIPIEDRISLIAQTGWSGIGLVHADLIRARDTIGYEELSRLIKKAGIDIVEVEFLNDWWASGLAKKESDRIKADLFEAAKALGAPHLKVGAGEGVDGVVARDQMGRAFAELADEAESAGLKLALEATPFSHLKTIEEAVEVVEYSDSPAAGLMVDIWHTAKIGIPHEDLYKIVPIEKVNAVEVDDGFMDTPGTLFEDSSNRRTYPGLGEFDAPGFIRATLDAGWTGPWGVEVISEQHRKLPVAEGLKKAYDTTVAAFAAAEKLPKMHR